VAAPLALASTTTTSSTTTSTSTLTAAHCLLLQVIATEVSKASVVAAAANLEANGVTNVRLARMSAEEFTDTWRSRGTRQRLSGLDWDSLRLTTLLVDPPRGGLDAETEALMANFERVVYVSCNPATLAANLRAVAATHDIARLAVFDQVRCGLGLVG
jgi:tRNA (uracil-5-)-methyltransferase